MPNALIAIIKAQRDISLTPPCTTVGTQPVLLIQARIKKPTANQGNNGGRSPPESAPCRPDAGGPPSPSGRRKNAAAYVLTVRS